MRVSIINLMKTKLMYLESRFCKLIKRCYEYFYYRYRSIIVKKNPIYISSTHFNDFIPNCYFFYEINNRRKYTKIIKYLGLEYRIIADADKICNHIFDLLGSGDINLGNNLPWNEDFKVGYRWENNFYRYINIIDLSNDSDVKVPWELSRFQHIFTLGKAYWITKNAKYSIEFKREMEDWIEKNPSEMSVNWTCAMEVAIRAVNWICGYFFFYESLSLDCEFWNKFNKYLYLHGQFIMNNLENKGEYNNNHYLADLCGLIWLGIYFGDFAVENEYYKSNPEEWLKFALKEFEKEMFIEVNEDGTDYEASTYYHKFVTEIFLLTTILCNKNNINFSQKYMVRLEKMCEFIMYTIKTNGLSPLIGDCDDGRLLILSDFSKWDRKDFTSILAIAGQYFHRYDFICFGKKHIEDTLWIMKAYKKSVKNQIILKSRGYKNGGYYILRKDKVYCIIRCGELSCRGNGGHSHNDQLSFELNIDGEDFIIDPGTYVYTSDYKMRNFFRSTIMHNTVFIGNREQNDYKIYGLFFMKEETFSVCTKFTDYEFEGKHFGYINKYDITHKRRFVIENNSLYIYDYFKTLNELKVKKYITFVLDKNVKVIVGDKYFILKSKKNRIKLKVKGDFNFFIDNVFKSSSYGILEKCKAIKIVTYNNRLFYELTIL